MLIDAPFLDRLSYVTGCRCSFVRSVSSCSDQILLDSDLALVYHFDCEYQAASIAYVLDAVGSLSPAGFIFSRFILYEPALFPRVVVVSWVGGTHLLKSQFDIVLPSIYRVCSSFSACSVPVSGLRNIFELFMGMILESLSGVEFFDSYLKTFCRFPPCLSPCLVHGDFSPHNMLMLSEPSCIGLIDWEYSGYAYRDFDLGWYLAVCSFLGRQDLRPNLSDYINLNYFICFGYLRLAARIVRRRASFDLLRILGVTSLPASGVYQQQLDLIKSRLLEFHL